MRTSDLAQKNSLAMRGESSRILGLLKLRRGLQDGKRPRAPGLPIHRVYARLAPRSGSSPAVVDEAGTPAAWENSGLTNP